MFGDMFLIYEPHLEFVFNNVGGFFVTKVEELITFL